MMAKIFIFQFILIGLLDTAQAFTVKAADLKCKKNEDCVITNNSCSHYVGIAVNKNSEKGYGKLLEKECLSYKGQSASMAEGGPYRVSCQKNQCMLQDSFVIETCSTVLADCFKNTIPDLEAGDSRLQEYETRAKTFLKDLKKNDKKGFTFSNQSVLLKDWSLVEKIQNLSRNLILLKDPSGRRFAFVWSEKESFVSDISKECSANGPSEFLSGEVYTRIEISRAVVVVGECGIKKLISVVKK